MQYFNIYILYILYILDWTSREILIKNHETYYMSAGENVGANKKAPTPTLGSLQSSLHCAEPRILTVQSLENDAQTDCHLSQDVGK